MDHSRVQGRLTWPLFLAAMAVGLLCAGLSLAEDPPLTRDVPIEEFQNRGEVPSYDFDAPPQGLIRSIQFAEGF